MTTILDNQPELVSTSPISVLEETHCFLYPPHAKKGRTLCNPSAEMHLGHNTDRPERFINVTTTPKSGTHLLIKVLKILGVNYKYKSQNMSYAPHLCQYANLLPYAFLDTDILKSTFDIKEKYIVTIRDPKDFLISYIQWIDKEMDEKMIPYEQAWKDTSIAEKLNQLLKGGEKIVLDSLKSAPWYIGNYLVAARLMDLGPTHILFLKFEDLIGPEMGGSSKQEQVKAFKKLCEFTETRFTTQKIRQLVKLLPGSTLTYIPQKKVGKWKELFTEENKRHYNVRFKFLEGILGYPFETETEKNSETNTLL